MTEKLKHTASLSIYSRSINFDSKLPGWTYQWEEEEEKKKKMKKKKKKKDEKNEWMNDVGGSTWNSNIHLKCRVIFSNKIPKRSQVPKALLISIAFWLNKVPV